MARYRSRFDPPTQPWEKRADNLSYQPRHALPVDAFDLAALRRRSIDTGRAQLAVIVLAATDDFEPSRQAYRELLRAGALTPRIAASLPVSAIGGTR
ncbi:MAG TPA: hypothetical protein VHC18_18310 [Amycolatopsis sp.]|nr:hypothetical protein [Amycolatopsis sp.]